jgi:hypothetical protein
MLLPSSPKPGRPPAQAASAIGSVRIATHFIDIRKFDIPNRNPSVKISKPPRF